MLKLGICKPAQDTRMQRAWRRGLPAATLLLPYSRPSEYEACRFEKLMSHICASNGVNKITARSRFAEFDLEVQNCLKEVFPSGSRIFVEDYAASCGITAAEWFAVLRCDYPNLRFAASDMVLYLIEVRQEKSGDIYILEPDGAPVQYICPPFVVSLVQPQSRFYAINRHLQDRALRIWKQHLAPRLRLPADWKDKYLDSDWVSVPPFSLRMLPLVHPEVLQLSDRGFRMYQHSIFAALSEPADVIRTMNVLNRAYFSEERLREASDAIERSLRNGGIWIVGRTAQENPPRHHATIFRKSPDGWTPLARIGAGSEIEPIVAPFASQVPPPVMGSCQARNRGPERRLSA